MTTRIGLALGHDAVRAVVVRRHHVVWAAEAAVEPNAVIAEAVAALLDAAPVRRFPRAILSVAVGAHASQLKLAAGLPDVQDAGTLAAIIKESAASFFLKNGVPLVTTGTQPVSSGIALAGAIDGPSVELVRDICWSRRWQLGFIAPLPVALIHGVLDSAFSWTDARVVTDVGRSDGTIESIRTRSASGAEPGAAPQPVPALATLGEGAVRYADAYGAALLEGPQALALDALAAGVWTTREARRRLVAPVLALALAIVAFALSPLGASRAARRAQARLATVQANEWRAVASATQQLDRLSAILTTVQGFSVSRSPATPVAGALARALPEGSTLLSLELSDEQGQISVLTPNPAAVVAAVQRLPGARSAELVGAVRRDASAAREAQRVTVRWRRGRA